MQRLMALHYGAGLVWGPEIVDKAIIGAQRVVDRAWSVVGRTARLEMTESAGPQPTRA